jgi:hypothetical protein
MLEVLANVAGKTSGGLDSFSAADVLIDAETHTDTIDRFIEK